MNIIYTVTWPGTGTETFAKAFYQQLRAGVASGKPFAFASPYEVALVCNRDHEGAQPFVAIMGMSVASEEIGRPNGTIPVLEEWFTTCGADLRGGCVTALQATHLKVSSELGISVNVLENFGTFVGEPEAEPEPGAKKDKAERVPVLLETAGLKAVLGEPLTAAEKSKLAQPPVIPPALTPTSGVKPTAAAEQPTAEPRKVSASKPPTIPAELAMGGLSPACSTWLTVGALAGGGLLFSAGMLVAGLLLLGSYPSEISPDIAASPTSEVISQLLICSGPFLVLGVIGVVIGLFLLRWLRAQTAKARA